MSDKPRFANKTKQAEVPNVKTLNIKINSLARTIKDLQYAKKEVETESKRLETFKTENQDRVSQQENVLKEAEMMVPHSENRIRSGIKDLSDYLEKERANIADEELIENAEKTLKNAEEALNV
ncbi:tubulin binding protein cofactor A-like protein [Strigomonas culicis]|uniref:Tubulin-specific chaperone A n=2 Tax=Strigomonas culicis TaxID=28005 RepID=S9V432_9TRYP|nr:tubulin binding protein cofactor A-like protein [Strigomonas culicis]|eukprot:EPY35663.1 tubulin binding protein cofactor A-like protein [Strigomonas culicis]